MSGSETPLPNSLAAKSTETRPFGLWTATALVVGGMIGAGIFVLPAQLAPFGWTGVAAWGVAIAGALVLARVLSRLTRAMPDAPGVIAISGRALGPLPGVLVGWSYWVSIWAANAVLSLTAARYASSFVPALTATPLVTAISAVVLIWLMTLLNLAGARTAGNFQILTTLLKLVPLLVVAAIVLIFALQGGAQFSANPHPGFQASTLAPALPLAFYALVGFESASVAAERVRRPEVNVARATIFGTVAVGALYLLVCTGIVFALPQDVAASSPAPFATFIETFWGRGPALAIAAFALIAAVGCLNGWVLIQGEVPLGMARAGLLPAWFARVNARDVPVRVLLLASTLASILVLSNAASGDVLNFMLTLSSAANLWLYIGACAAALKLKMTPVAAVIGLAFSALTLWGAGWYVVGLSVALMLSALPLYWLRGRRGAVQR